ncbi:hypothetical protein LCGC14_2357640 [marine sediment metagenome]|uniref:Uncharacterized protein n=1 Tax=marine sediment metagenome TaxID=412755 RepID=A0A0F9C7D4_9ZZZZ
MKSFATLINEIEQELQDTGNDIWGTPELGIQLEDSIREVSDARPHLMEYVYKLESRSGAATSTTSDALVDATESQFLSTDTDKVIYNTYDNTWAIVTAFVSTSQLTLSKDIMVSTEAYVMYNKGCRTRFQINIEDITDWVGPAERGVIAVEYPKGRRRNFTIEGDILTVDIRSIPDSKVTTPATDVEVFIWVEARQRVSQLTDLLGAIDNASGYAAGSTTLHVDDFAASEIIAEDTLLTIAGVRGTYRVTADATLSSSEIDILIHPALIDAAAQDDVITVIGSTLNSELERLVVKLTAGQAGISKAQNAVNTGGNAYAEYERMELKAQAELDRLKRRRAPRTSQTFPNDRVYYGTSYRRYY